MFIGLPGCAPSTRKTQEPGLPAVAHWLFRVNEVFAFWFAYILMRLLGASFEKPIYVLAPASISSLSGA